MITFRDFKGFKKVDDIRELYSMGAQLGKGSFGEVRKALNLKLKLECAVKIIKKASVNRHQILVNLMHNELKVLEETV
jgi:serine/threonine protein kinase